MTPDERPIHAAIGAKVRTLRQKKNLRQDKFAASAGMCPAALCAIEKGHKRITLGQLYNVADCLGVEPWHLMPGFVSASEAK